jgi:uncharacterized protein
MKILFDIGHPANVHYFRNLIKWAEKEGHQYRVLARDKDVTLQLLKEYQIPFINKGKGGVAYVDRLIYSIKSLFKINKAVREFKPDICISHASPYLAVIASFRGLNHIMFNDTERALLFKHIVKYCKPNVFSPDSFVDKDHYNLETFPSYMELAYLHPEIYSVDDNSDLVEKLGKDFILLRFVANKAAHDMGTEYISDDFKRELVQKFREYGNVWITSESSLPDDLKKYKLEVPPSAIHNVIANAMLLVGDSATMSSEAAMLGVPSIFINQNKLGYITELEETYGLVQHFMSDDEGCRQALQASISILETENRNAIYQKRRDVMLKNKINLTEYMIQLVQKYAGHLSNELTAEGR